MMRALARTAPHPPGDRAPRRSSGQSRALASRPRADRRRRRCAPPLRGGHRPLAGRGDGGQESWPGRTDQRHQPPSRRPPSLRRDAASGDRLAGACAAAAGLRQGAGAHARRERPPPGPAPDPVPGRGGRLCRARSALHRARAARGPRRDRACGRGAAAAARRATTIFAASCTATPIARTARIRCRDGRGDAEARLRLFRRRRPFAIGRLCRRPDRRGDRGAARRGRRAERRLWRQLPHLQGHRVRHPRGRLARLSGRDPRPLRFRRGERAQPLPARPKRRRRSASCAPSPTRTPRSSAI